MNQDSPNSPNSGTFFLIGKHNLRAPCVPISWRSISSPVASTSSQYQQSNPSSFELVSATSFVFFKSVLELPAELSTKASVKNIA